VHHHHADDAVLMRRLVVVLALAAGCGPTRYTIVTNGGAPVTRGSCTDVALVERPDGLQLVPPNAPDCGASPGFVIPPSGTAALWRIAGGSWAGPAVAPAVMLKVPVLSSGEAQRSLSAGENQRGLSSGQNERGLSSGQNQRGLSSGQEQRALSSGQEQRGLSAGENQRGLSSGQNQRALNAGENQRGLAMGQQERSLAATQVEKPVVEIRKRASGDVVTQDKPVTFTIEVQNIGAAPLSHVAVIDRVVGQLAVTGTDATVNQLPDGSSLAVWYLPGPIEPRQVVSVHFTAVLR
jgi:uncharacterized repeat protein (TIGR01451 family)